jgi:hypothetical protein
MSNLPDLPYRITNGSRWPMDWEVWLTSREPRTYEAAGYCFTQMTKGPRWEVRRIATGELIDGQCQGLRLAVDVAEEHSLEEHSEQEVPQPARPEVTSTDLSNFLHEWGISDLPGTDAETLRAHFEIRWRPEPLEAAERTLGQSLASMYPLTLKDWERLAEMAKRVLLGHEVKQIREENRD